MPKLTPLSRRNLVSGLRKFGFQGPHSGGKHQYMIKGTLRLTIPNPHTRMVGIDLLTRILQQAGISREAWTEKQSSRQIGKSS
jgi:predicted RNA binding protein YcfA (HicA-like mRNA interferase family)